MGWQCVNPHVVSCCGSCRKVCLCTEPLSDYTVTLFRCFYFIDHRHIHTILVNSNMRSKSLGSISIIQYSQTNLRISPLFSCLLPELDAVWRFGSAFLQLVVNVKSPKTICVACDGPK